MSRKGYPDYYIHTYHRRILCISVQKNNTEILENFDRFLEYMNIKVIPIDASIAKQGAKARAKYQNFKAMDALQVATAIHAHCDVFFTNDKQLKQETRISCLQFFFHNHLYSYKKLLSEHYHFLCSFINRKLIRES